MEPDFQNLPNEIVDLDLQIEKTVQDIGRLSSFSQGNGGDALSKVRIEKMKALRFLQEKRIKILNKGRF
jgi:hypothetical protein